MKIMKFIKISDNLFTPHSINIKVDCFNIVSTDNRYFFEGLLKDFKENSAIYLENCYRNVAQDMKEKIGCLKMALTSWQVS